MSRERIDAPDDDDGVEQLLRQVGARDEPAAELARQVERAVHAEWRAMLDERKRRRRTFIYGLAASIAVAVVVATATLRWVAPDVAVAATIALIDGKMHLATRDGAEREHRVGDAVFTRETLRTDANSRTALDMEKGLSVRIDRNSLVKFTSRDRLVLSAGAVYIDADSRSQPHQKLVVETRAGDVRHLGTQYQVRQSAEAVEVSVREGRVEVASDRGADALASEGEKLRIRADGAIERTTLTANDPLWDWAAQAAPGFDIENQSLAAFLEWVARETGRTIVYATTQARRSADEITLRGSITGLDPNAALSAVLSTTELVRYPTEDAFIGIALATTIDSQRAAPR